MVRLLVFAYHGVGCACLDALSRFDDDIAAVITHRDAPDENLWFDSVAHQARTKGLPVYFSEDYDDESLKALVLSLAPDILYSFYFRRILATSIIDRPPMGAFNLHGSLLPRYRGRCPVNWVIINREEYTGVTLHRMESSPDTGEIISQEAIGIDPRETARSLFLKMIPAAGALISRIHPLIRTGRIAGTPQDHSRATVFPGRRPKDGLIDWNLSAEDIDALIRAVTRPYPGAFTYIHDRKMTVWEAVPESLSHAPEPGRILSVDPLVISSGVGGIRIIDAEFESNVHLTINDRLRQDPHHPTERETYP